MATKTKIKTPKTRLVTLTFSSAGGVPTSRKPKTVDVVIPHYLVIDDETSKTKPRARKTLEIWRCRDGYYRARYGTPGNNSSAGARAPQAAIRRTLAMDPRLTGNE